MKGILVKLDSQDCNNVERLHFEYNASLNIIAFLMSRDEVKDEHLQRYLDCSEMKYTALEIAKETISDKYRPVDLVGEYNYNFNFKEETITYWK